MSKKYDKFLRNKQWLYQQYWGEKQTLLQIAKKVGCCELAVWYALKKFGIPRRTISQANKGRQFSKEHKRKLSEAGEKKVFSEEHKRKLSKTSKENPPFKGRHHTEEAKQKQREGRKHRIFPKHHTKPELVFVGFCGKDNLPFKYTGDGSFWIGKGKDAINPDFVHLTKKIVVEVFSWFHDELRNRHVQPKSRYEDRKKIFKKHGYKMVVFWQEDLDREDAEQYVLSVLKRKKII